MSTIGFGLVAMDDGSLFSGTGGYERWDLTFVCQIHPGYYQRIMNKVYYALSWIPSGFPSKNGFVFFGDALCDKDG